VGNVQIYKEVLSAQFDWLRSRGVLAAETRQGPALSRRARHRSTPDGRLSAVLRDPSFPSCSTLFFSIYEHTSLAAT
jgi:hypothetical protein